VCAQPNSDDLVTRAFAETGLDDLGDIPYREPLDVLVESLHRDAGLDDERLGIAGAMLIGLLVKRLRLVRRICTRSSRRWSGSARRRTGR